MEYGLISIILMHQTSRFSINDVGCKTQIDPSPPATKEIVEAYNNLRGNILLLYDLRGALLQCDYELQAV